MPWINNQFFYSKRLLATIAGNYPLLYDGLPTRFGEVITNPWVLAEYKADFDLALRNLGKGLWSGRIQPFNEYRHYGRLQQIIIADIMSIDEDFLGGLGFYDIARLRGYAYFLMANFLNGGQNERTQNNTHR